MSSNNATSDKNTGTDKDRRNDEVPKKRFRIADIIMKKRDRHDLSPDEIEFFVECVVKETIQDAQLGK